MNLDDHHEHDMGEEMDDRLDECVVREVEQAVKDRDVEIVALRTKLAAVEAQRGQLAELGRALDAAAVAHEAAILDARLQKAPDAPVPYECHCPARHIDECVCKPPSSGEEKP
jgi:hypothetical protein